MTVIRDAEESERARAMHVLMLAFAVDPAIRWLWPEPDAYLRHFPRLLDGFGGRAFDHHSAQVTDDFRGAALWLPPGVTPDDEALDSMVEETVRGAIHGEVGEIFQQMAASVPAVPHWHLAFVGVDPFSFGQGIGAALLTHALAGIDRAGGIAYLESTNPRNLTLYQRHGFEVTRQIRVGDAPSLFPMVRPAR